MTTSWKATDMPEPDFRYINSKIEEKVRDSIINDNFEDLIMFLTADVYGPKCDVVLMGLTSQPEYTNPDYLPQTSDKFFCKLSSPLATFPNETVLSSEDVATENSIICTSNDLLMAVIKAALALTEYLYEINTRN